MPFLADISLAACATNVKGTTVNAALDSCKPTGVIEAGDYKVE